MSIQARCARSRLRIIIDFERVPDYIGEQFFIGRRIPVAEKKKSSSKKTVAAKKKIKAAAKPKKTKTSVSKKKTVKKAPLKKKKTAVLKRLNEAKRRLVDMAEDLSGEDIENLTKEEIEKELKAYEETKQKPVAAKPMPTDSPGLQLAKRISQLMFEKKAEQVVLADLEGLTSVTDFFVMCTATSDMHARAVSDHVQDELEKAGIRVHHKEGYSSLRWVLLDYVDVIAHVFQKDAREFYDLERLWGDAKFIPMKDEVKR